MSSLGYWLGTPDGTFGDTTEQAVYTLEKAAGITRDGIVGPVTEHALAEGIVPHPRNTSGTVIEVDLEDDLLMFVQNGHLSYTLNTSTGGGYTYTEDGVTAVADTPVGLFHVYRQVFGMVVDSLGQLWLPKLLDRGVHDSWRHRRAAVPGLPRMCEGEQRGDRMDMVGKPRADGHFCLGLLIERRPIASVTRSKESISWS